MQDIEQRLLSRFKWGLSAELHQPDYETRISILKNILYRDGVDSRRNHRIRSTQHQIERKRT
jgi:chromosomal replication initiation ATPase DnaA